MVPRPLCQGNHCFGIFLIVNIFLVEFSLVMFLASTISGLTYFSGSETFATGKIKYKTMFGMGIGVIIVLTIIINMYFFISCCGHFFTTHIFFLASTIIYVVFTASTKNVINAHKSVWFSNNQGNVYYQIDHECCGWENSSHYALDKCPFKYQSGCKSILTNYVNTRFGRLFDGFCAALVIGNFCLLVISVLDCCFGYDDICSESFGEIMF